MSYPLRDESHEVQNIVLVAHQMDRDVSKRCIAYRRMLTIASHNVTNTQYNYSNEAKHTETKNDMQCYFAIIH